MEFQAAKTLEQTDNYLSLPKAVGQVSSDVLLNLAHKHMQQGISNYPHTIVHHNTIASSAIVEAMLVVNDPEHLYDDERIAHIDTAEECLLQAIDAETLLLNQGYKPSTDDINLRRLLLNLDFMRVYKDIVCGEVTTDTRQEICASLEKNIREINQQSGYLYNSLEVEKQLFGLKSEIGILLDYWKHDLQDENLIALPSTRRGGDGTIRPTETHDIILFHESTPGVYTYHDAREITSGRGLKRKREKARRYLHNILHFNPKSGKIVEIESIV